MTAEPVLLIVMVIALVALDLWRLSR